METKIISQEGTKIKIEMEVDINGSLLEAEEAIQEAINGAGLVATTEALKRFDADGSPIRICDIKLTAKEKG